MSTSEQNPTTQDQNTPVQEEAAAIECAETFLTSVLEKKQVWALKHADGGWAACDSREYESTAIFLFWSEQALANEHSQGDWKDYQPTAIELDAFLETWLPGLDQEDHMIGMNWVVGAFGLEVEPLEIQKKLNSGDI